MADDGYPPLPEQRRFTTGEACRLCLVEQHTLRYWEQVFPPLAQVERRKNRRYYSKADILTIRAIKGLKDQGLTTLAIIGRLAGDRDRNVPGLPSQLAKGDKIRAELVRVIKLLE